MCFINNLSSEAVKVDLNIFLQTRSPIHSTFPPIVHKLFPGCELFCVGKAVSQLSINHVF